VSAVERECMGVEYSIFIYDYAAPLHVYAVFLTLTLKVP